MARIFASQLRGMNVLTDRGLQIGRLHDILVDEESGRILSLVVKPSKEAVEALPKDESGNALLPFSSVMAMRDYIVINERVLVIQRLKTRPPKPTPEEAPPEGEKAPSTEPPLL